MYIHWVRTKTAQIPWKIRLNSWENLTHYYLLTCCIVVNVIVWEIGRGKQAAGQSRAPGRVMWTKCLPCDTIQPMGSTLRNSNKIICKLRKKIPLQVPGKVFGESGRSIWSFSAHARIVSISPGGRGIVVSRKIRKKKLADDQEIDMLTYNKGSSVWISKFWTLECHFTRPNTLVSDNCWPVPWKLCDFLNLIVGIISIFFSNFTNFSNNFEMLLCQNFIVNTDWKILKNMRFLSDNCWQTSICFWLRSSISHNYLTFQV